MIDLKNTSCACVLHVPVPSSHSRVFFYVCFLSSAIALYNKGDFDNALIIFEEVVALEPKNYMSDDFKKTTELYKVSQYNIACCFSKINNVENSLVALRRCMMAGFEDYRKVRTDPSLANVQKSPKFSELLDKFGEPLINSNAINFVKNIFGGKR